MSIYAEIPGDRNVTKKEVEKILKYKDFITEIERVWNIRATVIPAITGATGTISISLRKYLSNIPGKHENKVLGTAHVLCKPATNVKAQNIRRCIQKSQDNAHNTQDACSSRVSR